MEQHGFEKRVQRCPVERLNELFLEGIEEAMIKGHAS